VSEGPNAPHNPKCPICGATDWFGIPGMGYALLVVKSQTGHALLPDEELVQPVEGFTCRSCRFLRLRITQETLEMHEQ